jgi:hypothetical protein
MGCGHLDEGLDHLGRRIRFADAEESVLVGDLDDDGIHRAVEIVASLVRR